MKITTRLDLFRNCKTASGTIWSNGWDLRSVYHKYSPRLQRSDFQAWGSGAEASVYGARFHRRLFDRTLRSSLPLTGLTRSISGLGIMFEGWAAAERRGSNSKQFKDFYLKPESKIWPWLSHLCHVRSTAGFHKRFIKAFSAAPCGSPPR